jgi:transposase
VREILNGIFYMLWTGCQWQALPKDLPPKSKSAAKGAQKGGSGFDAGKKIARRSLWD